jgi:hypothetical protein
MLVTQLWNDQGLLGRWQEEDGSLVELSRLLEEYATGADSRAFDNRISMILQRVWQDLCSNSDIRDLFKYDGNNLFALVEPSLHYFTVDVIRANIFAYQVVHHAIQRRNISVLLGSWPPVSPQSIGAFKAARQAEIPSIVRQHGGFNGYFENPILKYVDLQFSDYYFCFGDGVRKYVEKQSTAATTAERPLHIATPITIASSELRDLRVEVRQTGKGTPLATNRTRRVAYLTALLTDQRLLIRQTYYPPIWYWRLQRRVVQLCSIYPNVNLSIKTHPRDDLVNPLADWIEYRQLSNCQLVGDVSLSDLLSNNDLLILDTPATTLLQALTTNKKILLFADRRYTRIFPEARSLLEKRVTFSTTESEFLAAIHNVLEHNLWPPPANTDDDFLSLYGVKDDSQNPVGQAVWQIRRLIADAKSEK